MTKAVLKTKSLSLQASTSSFDFQKVPLLSVYFVQGALGLSRLATSYFFKDELHLSPAEMAAIGGIISIPWIIKPLYGFVSDGLPIFGYKRKSYLFFSGLVGALSWLALGTIVTDSTGAIIANVLGSASIAVSDVVVDSIVVEKSRPETEAIANDTSVLSTAGDLQSLCWGASAVGGIASAYYSGSLLETLSTRQVFQLTALFPLMISITSFFLDEKRDSSSTSLAVLSGNIQNQLTQLKNTLQNPNIYLPVLFIFMWQATPTADSAMFFYSSNELHFQPEFLGRVRLAANIASLIGIVLFRTKLKNYSSKSIILWTTLLSSLIGLTPVLLVTHYNRVLGLPDQLFSLADTVVLTVLGQIAFMPTLVLASTLCPPGIEGTLFASLMSIYNLAGVMSNELGAGLTSLLGVNELNYDNLVLLLVICSLSSLLPLTFLNLLDYAKPVTVAEAKDHIV